MNTTAISCSLGKINSLVPAFLQC